MTKTLHLIIAVIIAPTYLFSETVTIYATQSAQYSANECCTLNILTNQNSDSLYSQDCQDMGTYYGCGMSKHAPFWLFDLSILDSSIDIQSIQFNGNIPTEGWSDVYLSVSTTIGQISTSIASDLWSGGDWASGNGQYSSINWAMGDFSQNLPLEIISQGIISGQLNILTYTSNPWTIFSIVNSGDDAPRLVIDYENIDENCTADDGTDGVELWGVCYSIENTNSLNLSENGLTGQIPSEIGNLTNLEVLVLWGNNLSGGIPFEIGNLTYLEVLSLSWNNLSGEIPSEIGNLSNLKELYLHHNNFSEQIPHEIGNLVGLEYLELQDNNLSGEIPPEIGYLVDLEVLSLGWNSLNGHIPEDIGNLINLRELILISNSFTGEIPPGIGNMEYLNYLVLGGNSFSGGIPLEIFNLQSLEELNLWGNNFSGEIPAEISNLLNLERLWIDGNSFSGPIPESIGDLQNIYSINISYNQFSGEIPESICNLGLDWGQWGDGVYNGISNNNLCPPYPECISPSDIGYQDLSNCGDVVELWGEYYSIEYTTELALSGSGLTGPIPPEIGNLTNLTKLLLFDNNLVGEIPEEIGQLINLDYLHLRENQLSGAIPAEIGNLINLTKLYLNKNQLTGEIPLEIGNLIDLNKLYLNENQLTGSIPPEIGNLSNLTGLYLNSNQLSGIIPDEICNQGDSSPNLSNNQLCPPYPSCVEDYVGDQDTSGCGQVSIIDETIPNTYNLYNAYPNPFNPITTLRYDLPEDAVVNITIYDMMGRQVKTLVNGSQLAGYRSIQWNATNDRNEPVSAGLYLYTIQAGDYTQTKKMVLLK